METVKFSEKVEHGDGSHTMIHYDVVVDAPHSSMVGKEKYSCRVPMFDIYFSCWAEDDIRRKAWAMVQSCLKMVGQAIS